MAAFHILINSVVFFSIWGAQLVVSCLEGRVYVEYLHHWLLIFSPSFLHHALTFSVCVCACVCVSR